MLALSLAQEEDHDSPSEHSLLLHPDVLGLAAGYTWAFPFRLLQALSAEGEDQPTHSKRGGTWRFLAIYQQLFQ